MKKVIFLDAGHSITDPGTITEFGHETDYNRAIRDALISELVRNGFEVKTVPDDLDLKGSINWVNLSSSNIDDGLALAIHCNCCGRQGAESYYYGNNQTSKDIAQKLIDEYCKETGLINIGPRSDTTGRFGELGWIRQTLPWATLIECGFLDNQQDVEILKDCKRVARGIAKGICKIFGINYIEETNPPAVDREKIKKQIIELLNQL